METVQALSGNGVYIPEISDIRNVETRKAKWTRVDGFGYQVECAIMQVTPAMAQRFLDKMVKNRKPRAGNVVYLASQISENWLLNGETLIFDRDGELLNGQHRCLACIKSNTPFVTLAVRGIKRDAFDRIDTGQKRTASDVLSINDVPYAALIGAAIGRLLRFERGVSGWFQHGAPNDVAALSAHEIAEAYPRFKELDLWAPKALDVAKSTTGATSLWAAAFYLMAKKDHDQALMFAYRISSGLNVTSKCPEYNLRKKLINIRGSAKQIKMKQRFLGAMIVQAWNARRRGTTLVNVRGITDDEKFPEII